MTDYRLGYGAEQAFADSALTVGTHTVAAFTAGDFPTHAVGDLLVIAYEARRDTTGTGGTSSSNLPAGWAVAAQGYDNGVNPAVGTAKAVTARLLWRIADGTSGDNATITVTRTAPGTNTVAVNTTAIPFAYHFASDAVFHSSGGWLTAARATTTITTPDDGVILNLITASTVGTTAPSFHVASGRAIRHTSTTLPPSIVCDSIFSYPNPPGGSVSSPAFDNADAAVWVTFQVELYPRPSGYGVTTGTPLGAAAGPSIR